MSQPTPTVVQHNALIEARYQLSLQEKRLVLWMLSLLRPGDEDFRTLSISVKELGEFLGITSHEFHNRVKEATGSLRTRTLDIYNHEQRRFIQTTWLSAAVYHLDEGTVELHISPVLKPYLLELRRNFTQLQLAQALSLHSIYSIRIYELLKQYQKLHQREMTLVELRSCLGIEYNEYKLFGHFRDRVLERARQEINAKTDLRVSYEYIKDSRKVVAIRFLITQAPVPPQAEPLTDGSEPEMPAEAYLEPLLKHGLTPEAARKLWQAHTPEQITRAIQQLEAALRDGKAVRNPAGWLLKAIEKGWNTESEYQQEQEDQAQAAEAARRERQTLEQLTLRQEARKQELKRVFDRGQQELVQERWELLDPEQQQEVLEKILTNELARKAWQQRGIQSPLIVSLLRPQVLTPEEQDFEYWHSQHAAKM